MKIRATAIAIVLGGSFTAALAEDQADVLTRYGASITAGGGVGGFADNEMRETTDVGGSWDVRAAIGTRTLIGFEAGYLGTAQGIDAIGLDTNAVLLGTALQGVARLNGGQGDAFNPYVFAGMAWRRYDLTNIDTNTSDVTDSDNLLEVPFGLGMAYRYDHFVADVRGEVRVATFEDLIPSGDAAGEDMAMHTWGASAQVGYEF